ncbi:glycosyltransferase family 2 protein [Mesonia aquimarina]|uniref:glycosyltransferase family 2 protein n=1 Tax=Mesonia aquimarina TaxID=1504967 RepID=UPI000EF56C2E|nr:glycosyltransferase family 2 protein [Mesonia aquimarina]
MEKLTALIPTGNEIHNIEEVIASVDFADEILVVDSFSTDGTFEKAKELADKVLQREFDYPSAQKNWAIPQAKHDWVLLVDADERVTSSLKEEILNVLKNPPTDIAGYWIGRQNYFMNKPINHSGWKNDKVIRLFKKDECQYNNKRVHEEIITEGNLGKLTHKFIHYTYTSFDNHIEKVNKYAWWRALDYKDKVGKLTAYHFIIKPFWGFFKHYIMQSGFRDGIPGLTIAFLRSYSIFTRYLKIWLLRKGIK